MSSWSWLNILTWKLITDSESCTRVSLFVTCSSGSSYQRTLATSRATDLEWSHHYPQSHRNFVSPSEEECCGQGGSFAEVLWRYQPWYWPPLIHPWSNLVIFQDIFLTSFSSQVLVKGEFPKFIDSLLANLQLLDLDRLNTVKISYINSKNITWKLRKGVCFCF